MYNTGYNIVLPELCICSKTLSLETYHKEDPEYIYSENEVGPGSQRMI